VTNAPKCESRVNNLLTVILGYNEMLRDHLKDDPVGSEYVAEVLQASERASALTNQLLAFSRRQVSVPRLVDLNILVRNIDKMLRRIIGEDIQLEIELAPSLPQIEVDPGQIDQVIMNLAVNSRDAMPGGGKLLIETLNVDLDSEYSSAHTVVRQGKYVLLAVSDSGSGMDAETQAHIFEPFFTTKPQGKGTGLGLATVYGIVKQSGGFIWVYSEVGRGTCFKIYLPRVEQPVEKSALTQSVSVAPRGTGTILLAEDEHDVREVAREFLESGGYTVIEAHDGAEAIQLAEKHAGAIQLLVTDMVMPGMTGQELAGRLHQRRAGLRVLYMSGYSEHAAAESALGDTSMRLLTKPFSRLAILRAVHEILAQA
jgi:two-component system cell cycle sensor histidine kinase/response regulator CckA